MKCLKSPLLLALTVMLFMNVTLPPNGPEYAMTAKLNGNYFEMNNMFGYNEATEPNINFYLSDDFIELRGRTLSKEGDFEIYLWISKTDLKEGTFIINPNTMTSNRTHAGLAYSSSNTELNGVYRKTLSGKITITDLDKVNKTIKGNFSFKANPEKNNTGLPAFEISEGTFNYVYGISNNTLDI